ncbi:MAG: hypothetical protein AAF846_26820 [Chloroflexota bacterium]
MKKISIIAFRGTSFRDPKYKTENALIRAGHVGWIFEDEPDVIYGFHPTNKAVEEAGGVDQLILLLKGKKRQPGSIQDDTAVFVRAYQLAQAGARTQVYEITYNLIEDEYDAIYARVMTLYETQAEMWYNFPKRDGTFEKNESNCAIFPSLIGIPIPSLNGLVGEYIQEMRQKGATEWHP